MPRRKVATGTVAISEAIPQQPPKNLRKQNPNAREKRSGSGLARRKRVAVLVSIFINYILLNVDSTFSV